MDAASARSGVVVEPEELDLHVVSNLPQIGEIYVCFRGSAKSDEVSVGLECDGCGFFSRDEIPWDHLAFPELVG